MATREVKAILSRMNLIDEAVSVVVTNNGQELITIDDISQLNEKTVEGLCWVLRRTGGTIEKNPGITVSVMVEVNLQGMIYYINQFKNIRHTVTHADVELSKFRSMYH